MAILEVNNIDFEIAKEKIIVNSSFDINAGDVVLLTGPNGCGKSTIIKIIMGDVFDYSKLKYGTSKVTFIKDEKTYDILNKESNMEFFRKNVCYVSQDDEFESNSIMDCFLMSLEFYPVDDKTKYVFKFVKQFAVYEAFYYDSKTLKADSKGKKIMSKLDLKWKNMSNEEKKTIKFLSMTVKKMSGGQRKLANIVTNLIRYEFCSLIILDEPLNNLDYNNVRTFSDILTRIYKSRPEIGILMVTHCRSIPIINKVIDIDANSKKLGIGATYSCNSCFGELSSDGLYI